jgi:hypothetical protein
MKWKCIGGDELPNSCVISFSFLPSKHLVVLGTNFERLYREVLDPERALRENSVSKEFNVNV